MLVHFLGKQLWQLINHISFRIFGWIFWSSTDQLAPESLKEKNDNKEIKKRAECIVELYKHAGSFKNTREVLEKLEPQASVSRTSRVFLKIPKCLYNSNNARGTSFFNFFYKIETQKRVPLLVLKRSNYKSIDIVLHFFKKLFPYR